MVLDLSVLVCLPWFFINKTCRRGVVKGDWSHISLQMMESCAFEVVDEDVRSHLPNCLRSKETTSTTDNRLRIRTSNKLRNNKKHKSGKLLFRNEPLVHRYNICISNPTMTSNTALPTTTTTCRRRLRHFRVKRTLNTATLQNKLGQHPTTCYRARLKTGSSSSSVLRNPPFHIQYSRNKTKRKRTPSLLTANSHHKSTTTTSTTTPILSALTTPLFDSLPIIQHSLPIITTKTTKTMTSAEGIDLLTSCSSSSSTTTLIATLSATMIHVDLLADGVVCVEPSTVGSASVPSSFSSPPSSPSPSATLTPPHVISEDLLGSSGGRTLLSCLES